MSAKIPHEVVGRLHQGGQRLRTQHNGQVMHWRGFGGGPTLVLIHGGHGSWLHWARNIEPLAASHRVLVRDLPGFRETGAMPQNSKLTDFVDAIVVSLDQLVGVSTPFALVGFSFATRSSVKTTGASPSSSSDRCARSTVSARSCSSTTPARR